MAIERIPKRNKKKSCWKCKQFNKDKFYCNYLKTRVSSTSLGDCKGYIYINLEDFKSKKKKYYAVKVGRVPGIYRNWTLCKEQVYGYPKAKYKAFETIEEAYAFIGI